MPDTRLARRSLDISRDRPEDHVNNTAGYEEWSNTRLVEVSAVAAGGQETSVLGLRNEGDSSIAGRLVGRNEIVNAMYPPATFPNGVGLHAHGAYYDIRFSPETGQEEPFVICHFGGNPSHWHWSYRDGEDILPIMEEGHVHGPLMIFNERGEPERKLRFSELRKPFEELIKSRELKVSIDDLMSRFPTSPDQRSTPMDPVENKEPTTEERVAALEAQNQRNEAILNLPKDQQDHVRGLTDDAAKDEFLAKDETARTAEVERANIDPTKVVNFEFMGRSYNSHENPDMYVAYQAFEKQNREIAELKDEREADRSAERADKFFSHCRTADTGLTRKIFRVLETALTAEELAEADKMFRSMTAVANSGSNVFDINTGRTIDEHVEIELDVRENTPAGLVDAANRKIDDLAKELRSEDEWKDAPDSKRRLEVMRRNPDLKDIVDKRATIAA